jgi:sporulation protein YlmC with PRC-barrel domain
MMSDTDPTTSGGEQLAHGVSDDGAAVVPAADSEEFRDHEVRAEMGEKLGKVADVVYDAATNKPTWLVVHTGVMHGDRYLPVDGSYRDHEGEIVTPYDKHTLQHAAKAHKDHVLTADLEHELSTHYGLARP